jgi:aspartate aminotransferase-like enzyme
MVGGMAEEPLMLFITGPTYVRMELKEAAINLGEFGHRDAKEVEKRFNPIFNNLKRMWEAGDGYSVVIINGSGTTALETSIRSLVDEGETVLNVSTGAFGDLYHNIALKNKKSSVKTYQLKFRAGEAIDLDMLEDTLKFHRPNVVTLTHNETSTGVVNPIVEACELVRMYGGMPLVDGVSIFGGAPTPIEKIKAAMYSTSTQKALALDAGFGLAIVSQEALEKAARINEEYKGYTTDLSAHAAAANQHRVLTTPNCSLANQLMLQTRYILEEEGIENRFRRHEEMRDITHKFVEEELAGFELFPKKGYASPTVTCIQVPPHLTMEKLKEAKEQLRQRGYLMDTGYRGVNTLLERIGSPLTMRIGHMGDITTQHLEEYLMRLKDALMEHRR